MTSLLLLCAAVVLVPACAPAAAGPAGRVPAPARIRRMNGIGTLVVDGAPFLVLGAQCDIWRSTRQDARAVAFFDGYHDMNATTVSVGVPWSKIEPQEGRYDFAFLDWFVRQAESRRLKLVLNLFNTNVCGKVAEVAPNGFYPQYTPEYILSRPEKYQRMVLPGPWRYAGGGPPMCPNDPDTLERERRLVARVAEHLKRTDARRTVILLQIDNEFYYQQWEGERPPDAKAVRCRCPYCEAEWAAAAWANGEEFMFRSFAEYARVLTDAIAGVYSLPLYVNSPWWEPYIIPIFLDACPNLALVGVDGVFSPHEPNMLSRSQLGRNLPFAAENPTEQPHTRLNLDVLPYYTVVGQQGIGNLLWECGPPCTVVDDPEARRRYGDALYPLKHAQAPIARARGTDRLVDWYAIREAAPDAKTDAAGNLVPAQPGARVVRKEWMIVREGLKTRRVDAARFETVLAGRQIEVSGSSAGVLVARGRREIVAAVPGGTLVLRGKAGIRAESGRFERDRWHSEGAFPVRAKGDTSTLEVAEPRVLRLTW